MTLSWQCLLVLPFVATSLQAPSKNPYSTKLFATTTSLDFNQIADRYRVTQFGQGPNAFYGLECLDRQYYCKDFSVSLTMKGGLGLDITEIFSNRDGISGLVLIEGSQPNSNAAKADFFQPGDAFISISSANLNFASLEGLNFDRTADILRKYREEESVTLKVEFHWIKIILFQLIQISRCGGWSLEERSK